jgi:hypothetical protein
MVYGLLQVYTQSFFVGLRPGGGLIWNLGLRAWNNIWFKGWCVALKSRHPRTKCFLLVSMLSNGAGPSCFARQGLWQSIFRPLLRSNLQEHFASFNVKQSVSLTCGQPEIKTFGLFLCGRTFPGELMCLTQYTLVRIRIYANCC